MHELSIALNIVEMAEEQAATHGVAKVVAVHLRVGPLAGVAKEALRFSFGLACEGTVAEGSALLIDEGQDRELEMTAVEIE
jgi:hydrogenase nickel incorporation protein HypA/HybF